MHTRDDGRDQLQPTGDDAQSVMGEGLSFLTKTVFRRLHDEQRTDMEIAAITGVTLDAVVLMRTALELPAHTRLSTDRSVRSQTDGRDDAYQRYYDMGMIDAEIARQVGVTRSAVYEWRWGRKIPAHRRNLSTDVCWRHYTRGFSDREIAAATGIDEPSVQHWRFRYNLPEHAHHS